MCIGISSILSFCCTLVTFQLIAGATLRNAVKVVLGEDTIRRKEIDFGGSIVYPELYDLDRRRRRVSDETPTLTLILRAINITYYIELERNENFNEVPVHFETDLEPFDHDSRCHFHGTIISKPTGFVAISACSEDGKMTGILMIEEKIYFLRPISNANKRTTENEHYLHEYSEENTEFCGINNARSLEFAKEKVPLGSFQHDKSFLNRIKRGTSSSKIKIIEVAIFVDSELYKKIEATTTIDARLATVRRVLGIMNQVQLIYNYSSLQTKFKIVIVKVQILRSNQTAPDSENGDIDKYLDNFCVWQSKLNTRDGNDDHWDHAIMLTGRDLFKDTRGKRNLKVLGLAWVNGMCRTNYSCTINEGTSFEAAFVIAHEIAHNLGVMHDGSGNNCDRNKYIMSDKTGPGKVHWSACSNVYLKNFFRNGNGECLSDDASPPNRSYDLESRSLPGVRYSLSDQCILALGSGYTPHKSSKEPFNNVCRELWCASGTWAKPAHPALEGSPCAEGKLCLEGSCRSSALVRNGVFQQRTNTSTTKHITLSTPRHLVPEENGGILRKIQDAFIKAIKNVG